MQAPRAYGRGTRKAQGLVCIQSKQVTRNLSTCSGIFNRTCWLPEEPCGGIQSSSSPWAHLSDLYFSFQGEFLLFPLRKKSRLSSWPRNWSCVISFCMAPSAGAAQEGWRPFPRSIFLSSHLAFICHTVKYKSICCHLVCQSRRAQSHPRPSPSWRGCQLQRPCEGHAITIPNVTGVRAPRASATSGTVGAIVGNTLAKGVLTHWNLLWG